MVKLITRENIENGDKFILKWTKNPVDNNGAYNPGWKQQMESDRFLELIETRPSIMNDARFMPMNSIEYDVSFLTMKAPLQSMRQLANGQTPGGQINDINTLQEAVPAFSRSKLVAHPFTAYTWTAKTFLLENIEKQSFLNHIEGVLAERAGYSTELIGMYGKKAGATATASGYDHIDGLFKQLEDVRTAYDSATNKTKSTPMGRFEDIKDDQVLVKQLKKMIAQFSTQKGKRSLAKIYVSSTMEADLILEAEDRPTKKGDNLYFQDGQLTLWGVPIVSADFLNEIQNHWADTPESEASQLTVKDLVLIANPDSIIFGFLNNFDSENTYEHQKKAYLSSIDVYFDVLLLLNKDALYARVVSPKGN